MYFCCNSVGYPHIGTLDFNLNGMPKPAHSASSCSLEQLPDMDFSGKSETINLFEKKRTKGFWPVYSRRADGPELTVRSIYVFVRRGGMLMRRAGVFVRRVGVFVWRVGVFELACL